MEKTNEVSRMVSTLKINIFKPVKIETVVPKIIDGIVAKLNGRALTERIATTVPSYVEIDGHIAANIEYCDLTRLSSKISPKQP